MNPATGRPRVKLADYLVCDNCKGVKWTHVDGKCLFAPTTFKQKTTLPGLDISGVMNDY
jgi:hypothetical protein